MSHLRTNGTRIGLVLAAVLGAIFLPWWIPLLAMIALAVGFSAWEVPLIGLFIDFLWLPGAGHFSIPLFTIAGILFIVVCTPLRDTFLS